jgi:hypothetical protein
MRRAASCLGLLAGLLVVLSVAVAEEPTRAEGGVSLSVQEGTQLNLDSLSVGVGSVLTSVYLDDQNVRQSGLHATLDLVVEGRKSSFRQIEVHEGQTVEFEGYRFRVEKLFPERTRGLVVLTILSRPDRKQADGVASHHPSFWDPRVWLHWLRSLSLTKDVDK